MYETTEEIKKDLFVQKTKLGDYRVVYPIVKDIKQPFSLKNIHWKNFLIGGKWSNVITLVVILSIILFSAWAYKTDMVTCKDHLENPCKFCTTINYGKSNNYNEMQKVNISEFKIIKVGDLDEGVIQNTTE